MVNAIQYTPGAPEQERADLMRALAEARRELDDARELTGERYTAIGASFGGRSHSTVLHACSRIASLVDEDPGLRQQLRRVRQVLKIT